MSEATIDLVGGQFWIALALGIVLLTPLRHPGLRRWVFAAVNVAFLVLLLKVSPLVVGASLLITFGLLKGVEQRGGGVFLWVLGVAITVLFLIHKRPDLGRLLPVQVNPILAAVSFSYVALRLVELLRAVSQKQHPAPHIAEMINYLIPFHMLPAGPIQSYQDFRAAPSVPAALSMRSALEGTERIVLGLFKKYVLAYLIQRTFLTGFHSEGLYFVLEMQLFYLWLFLDFTAYSDIAVGAGRLMGIETPENFDRPLSARNMIQFWERWHISLSLFIRRNLFIPIQLGLQRRISIHPLWIASVAFAVSFLLCGLWHQLSWSFLAWGGFHAIGLILCNLYANYLKKQLKRSGVKEYLQSRRARVLATFLTYQWVAFSLVLIAYPWNGGGA